MAERQELPLPPALTRCKNKLFDADIDIHIKIYCDKAQKLRNKDYVLLKMQAQKLIVRNNKQQINIPLVFFFILIGILLQ